MRAEITSAARDHRSAGGFTLIELMFVGAILAIFLTIGIPEMTEFVADQRVRTTTSDIAAEIALARAKAVEASRRVYMEKLTVGGKWNSGWRLYADFDNNGAYTPGTDIDIKRFDGFAPGRMYVCTVSKNNDFSNNIVFRPDGRIVRSGTAGADDGIYVVDPMNDPAKIKMRALLFGLSGRVTIVKKNGTLPPCNPN